MLASVSFGLPAATFSLHVENSFPTSKAAAMWHLLFSSPPNKSEQIVPRLLCLFSVLKILFSRNMFQLPCSPWSPPTESDLRFRPLPLTFVFILPGDPLVSYFPFFTWHLSCTASHSSVTCRLSPLWNGMLSTACEPSASSVQQR